MDYNQIATAIVQELKGHARRTDAEIAERLGISRQAYLRRLKTNSLTTEDITSLSAWLVTAFGGGFYLDKYCQHEAFKVEDLASEPQAEARTSPPELEQGSNT